MSNNKNIESERRALMLETPIRRLVPKMAVPTVVAMVVTSIYSMADTYFVSSLGTAATAAVGVNMSIDQAIMMAGSFLAIGSNSYIARLLGAKQVDKASRTLSTAFFTAFFLGILVAVGGLSFLEPLVKFLGATPSSTQYSIDYASYILIAAPFMASSFVLNQCLRSEGSPIYSMFGMGIGALLNIALDPILIFGYFGFPAMGVAGASIATAFSKLVGFCILIYPYIRRKSILRLAIKKITYSLDIIREISLMGLPSLLRMGLSVIAFILLNNMAGQYSDSALAGISVVTRIMSVPTFAILGFGQGFMPVAGYNWGAKKYDRVTQSFRFSSVVVIISMTVVGALVCIFSRQIIFLFTEGDAEMVEIGSFCLISQAIIMPLNAWVIIVNMLYSALGKPVGAIVLGITRQGLCFIPLVFILPAIFDIWGLAATQAVADLLSFAIAIPFTISALRFISATKRNDLSLPQPLDLNET